MSKELDALYNFIDDVNHTIASGGIHEIDTNNIAIIETALKNYEELKSILYGGKPVYKRLRALNVVEEKEVNVAYLKYHFVRGNGGYKEYKRVMNSAYLDYYPSSKMLTKDEFELLKEVLK